MPRSLYVVHFCTSITKYCTAIVNVLVMQNRWRKGLPNRQAYYAAGGGTFVHFTHRAIARSTAKHDQIWRFRWLWTSETGDYLERWLSIVHINSAAESKPLVEAVFCATPTIGPAFLLYRRRLHIHNMQEKLIHVCFFVTFKFFFPLFGYVSHSAQRPVDTHAVVVYVKTASIVSYVSAVVQCRHRLSVFSF